jgi:antitoxin component YwqK of YwqJK toxin-antitoxin module
MLRLKFIYITVCLSWTFVCAQVKDSLNRTDKNGLKQGHWIKKDDKGKVIYDGTFVNDKPIGKFTYYFPSGKIKSITTFYKKNSEAYTELFNPDGKKMMKGKVSGQLKDSTWSYYDDNDSLKAVENYQMGKKNGRWLSYYKNGKILQEQNYKNDVLEGPYKEYFDNGKPNIEYNFVKGLHDGKAKFYYPSGQLSIDGNYTRDFKEGTWNYFGENGAMDWQVVYKKSDIVKSKRYNGLEDEFYPSKIPKSKIMYKNGSKNGPFTDYYDAGQVKYEKVAAKDGYPDEVQEVISGQKAKRKGNYLNDKLDGKVTYYKLDGTIEKEETYKDGVLVK